MLNTAEYVLWVVPHGGVGGGDGWRWTTVDGTGCTADNIHTHTCARHMGCVGMYYVYVTTCITAVNIAQILDTPEIS